MDEDAGDADSPDDLSPTRKRKKPKTVGSPVRDYDLLKAAMDDLNSLLRVSTNVLIRDFKLEFPLVNWTIRMSLRVFPCAESRAPTYKNLDSFEFREIQTSEESEESDTGITVDLSAVQEQVCCFCDRQINRASQSIQSRKIRLRFDAGEGYPSLDSLEFRIVSKRTMFHLGLSSNFRSAHFANVRHCTTVSRGRLSLVGVEPDTGSHDSGVVRLFVKCRSPAIKKGWTKEMVEVRFGTYTVSNTLEEEPIVAVQERSRSTSRMHRGSDYVVYVTIPDIQDPPASDGSSRRGRKGESVHDMNVFVRLRPLQSRCVLSNGKRFRYIRRPRKTAMPMTHRSAQAGPPMVNVEEEIPPQPPIQSTPPYPVIMPQIPDATIIEEDPPGFLDGFEDTGFDLVLDDGMNPFPEELGEDFFKFTSGFDGGGMN